MIIKLHGSDQFFGLRRLKHHDNSITITKGVPDFCSVYVIAKGKVSATRSAVRPAPIVSPLRAQIQTVPSLKPDPITPRLMLTGSSRGASPYLFTYFNLKKLSIVG